MKAKVRKVMRAVAILGIVSIAAYFIFTLSRGTPIIVALREIWFGGASSALLLFLLFWFATDDNRDKHDEHKNK